MNFHSNQSDANFFSGDKLNSFSIGSNPDHRSNGHLSRTTCHSDLHNSKQFDVHFNSHQHEQAENIHDVLQSIPIEYRSMYKTILTPEFFSQKICSRELQCLQPMKLCPRPLLGLGSIIEFQFENRPDSAEYLCELCRCKCSTSSSLLSHLTSSEHQRKYLKTHHTDMYDRLLAASSIRSEQERLIDVYAQQILSRHGGSGEVRLYVQLNRFIGQKPLVLNVTSSKVQVISKAFEDYDYLYEDQPIKEKRETQQDSMQHRGLSPEDLLYPFNRQFWHEHYNDLLQSRPIDPHSMTYEEAITESRPIQRFLHPQETKVSLPMKTEENRSNFEAEEKFVSSANSVPRRRVIVDSSRTSNGSNNLIITTSNIGSPSGSSDECNEKKSNGSVPVLNEHSARAILAASGLLKPDEEDEEEEKSRSRSHCSSDQSLSPALAKRMLDAVLTGDLHVSHIQPYFSTFVNLIQSGQVELERHQAERLLQKLLVPSSKRLRSESSSEERRVSSTTTTSNRRVQLINESSSNHAERSIHRSKNLQH